MLWTDHFFSQMVSPWSGGEGGNAQGKVLRFQSKAGFHREVEVLPLFLHSPYILPPDLLSHSFNTEHFRITTFAIVSSAFLTWLQRKLLGQWDQAEAIIMSFSSKIINIILMMTAIANHLVLSCSVAKSCQPLCYTWTAERPCSSVTHYLLSSVQLLSHVRLFVTPWIAASLSITNSRGLPKAMSIKLVMPSSHLILCHPYLLLPPILPSIRVFPNESTLRMRWPKYWSFSFSISPSNENPGLISFRMDWLDLLAAQGTLKSFF